MKIEEYRQEGLLYGFQVNSVSLYIAFLVEKKMKLPWNMH